LAEYCATNPEPSLSMPIRMEQKRKRMQSSVACIIVGLATLGGAGFNFTRSGYVLIASYMTVLGLGFLGVGISLHLKAKKLS
jgi:hypothetical protein